VSDYIACVIHCDVWSSQRGRSFIRRYAGEENMNLRYNLIAGGKQVINKWHRTSSRTAVDCQIDSARRLKNALGN
jgi:hypothetical protein